MKFTHIRNKVKMLLTEQKMLILQFVVLIVFAMFTVLGIYKMFFTVFTIFTRSGYFCPVFLLSFEKTWLLMDVAVVHRPIT